MLLTDVFIIENMEVLEEGSSKGPMKVRGVFQRAEEANSNKRVYPKGVLESQLQKIQPLITERRLCGELDHPSNDTVKLSNASHLVTKLEMKGNEVLGEAEILDTPAGITAKALIKGGVRIGISSRGMGTLSEGEQEGTKKVNEDFKLVTFDLVADPSTRGAYPTLSESKQYETIIQKTKAERAFITLLEEALEKKSDSGELNEAAPLAAILPVLAKGAAVAGRVVAGAARAGAAGGRAVAGVARSVAQAARPVVQGAKNLGGNLGKLVRGGGRRVKQVRDLRAKYKQSKFYKAKEAHKQRQAGKQTPERNRPYQGSRTLDSIRRTSTTAAQATTPSQEGPGSDDLTTSKERMAASHEPDYSGLLGLLEAKVGKKTPGRWKDQGKKSTPEEDFPDLFDEPTKPLSPEERRKEMEAGASAARAGRKKKGSRATRLFKRAISHARERVPSGRLPSTKAVRGELAFKAAKWHGKKGLRGTASKAIEKRLLKRYGKEAKKRGTSDERVPMGLKRDVQAAGARRAVKHKRGEKKAARPTGTRRFIAQRTVGRPVRATGSAAVKSSAGAVKATSKVLSTMKIQGQTPTTTAPIRGFVSGRQDLPGRSRVAGPKKLEPTPDIVKKMERQAASHEPNYNNMDKLTESVLESLKQQRTSGEAVRGRGSTRQLIYKRKGGRKTTVRPRISWEPQTTKHSKTGKTVKLPKFRRFRHIHAPGTKAEEEPPAMPRRGAAGTPQRDAYDRWKREQGF